MIHSTKEAIGFCTERFPGGSGYNYTLTTLLGVFLREAEKRYGPRDHNWTPLGIEFCGDVPTTWFPGNCGNVSIILTDSARKDPPQAIFQLAHEVIHLLAPIGMGGAGVFEEGLATLFAHEMAPRYGGFFRNNHAVYLRAETLVRAFLSINPEGVRLLRAKQPSFSQFSPELIKQICPATPDPLTQSLCERFVRDA
jgi:hypothetical protein